MCIARFILGVVATAPYFAERSCSGAPGDWLTKNRMAKTGVACTKLFEIISFLSTPPAAPWRLFRADPRNPPWRNAPGHQAWLRVQSYRSDTEFPDQPNELHKTAPSASHRFRYMRT